MMNMANETTKSLSSQNEDNDSRLEAGLFESLGDEITRVVSGHGDEIDSLKLENGRLNAKITRQGVELTRLNLKITLQGADINRKLKLENDKLKAEINKLKAEINCLNLKINQHEINRLNIKINQYTLKMKRLEDYLDADIREKACKEIKFGKM
jgi:chromosome segregation ATPase